MKIDLKALVKTRTKNKQLSGRTKILKTFAGFLILMVVFTILSRAANSMTIPKVATGKTTQGTINRSISASGKVEKNQSLAVSTVAGIKVKSIFVKAGEVVRKDDILFELDLEDIEKQINELAQEIEIADLETSDKSTNAALEASQAGLDKQRALEDYNQAAASGNTAITQAYEAMIAAEESLNAYQSSVGNTSADELFKTYEEKEQLLTEAKEDLKKVEESSPEDQALIDSATAAVTQAQQDRDDALVAWKSSQASDDTLTELTEAYNTKVQAYNQAVADSKSSLTTAGRAVEDAGQPSSADSSEQISALQKESKVSDLEKLKLLYENNGYIKSDIDALVSEVGVSVGNGTPDGAAVVLADLSSGVVFTASITTEEQKYLSREDLVTLEASDGTVLSDLPILSMQVNGEDPSLMDVSVLLSDNQLEIGSQATLKFTNKSEVYKQCIPRAALNGDATEYYLLVLKETETVLGSELTVEKVVVTVLDQYGDYAAISNGSINSDQEFVVSSDKQIEDGDRVRRQEE